MKRNILRLLATLTILATMDGCGTICRNEFKEAESVQVYPATRYDSFVIVDMGLKGGVAVGFPEDYTVLHYIIGCPLAVVLGLVDLPISLITDTLCLPYDLLVNRDGFANQRMVPTD
jgi:uncharacterized protein YceK